jgi:hypothetical protein
LFLLTVFLRLPGEVSAKPETRFITKIDLTAFCS